MGRTTGLFGGFHHDQRLSGSLGKRLLLARASQLDRRFSLGNDDRRRGRLHHDEAAVSQDGIKVDRRFGDGRRFLVRCFLLDDGGGEFYCLHFRSGGGLPALPRLGGPLAVS